MRFDFHPTVEGWRVSEVNTDVPGGYNEASGLTSLAAEHVVGAIPLADPSEALVDAIAAVTPPGATVGLVHATAYSDDRQVMVFLARRLQRRGLRAVLLAPDHIQWGNGQAIIRTDWFVGRADFVFRFFPAEWLPNLGRQCDWASFLLNSQTPLCNPASALLTQSKRWPLVRNTLGLPLPTWTRYLPESRDPREVDWQSDPDWVVKPALGRVGDSIGLHGVTTEREWKTIRRSLRWNAGDWIIQRRFVPVPFVVDGRDWHACLGVYTINGRAAGIYGRVAPQPLINHLAREVAVLVEHAPTSTALDAPECYEPHRTL
jgi:glutathionylspermidine synthase